MRGQVLHYDRPLFVERLTMSRRQLTRYLAVEGALVALLLYFTFFGSRVGLLLFFIAFFFVRVFRATKPWTRPTRVFADYIEFGNELRTHRVQRADILLAELGSRRLPFSTGEEIGGVDITLASRRKLHILTLRPAALCHILASGVKHVQTVEDDVKAVAPTPYQYVSPGHTILKVSPQSRSFVAIIVVATFMPTLIQSSSGDLRFLLGAVTVLIVGALALRIFTGPTRVDVTTDGISVRAQLLTTQVRCYEITDIELGLNDESRHPGSLNNVPEKIRLGTSRFVRIHRANHVPLDIDSPEPDVLLAAIRSCIPLAGGTPPSTDSLTPALHATSV
jgi:hypothetical protein